MKNGLPTYSINIEPNSDLEEMTKAVSKFYPLNQEIENSSFSGYQVLVDTISAKFDQLLNGKSPSLYDQLIDELKQEFSDFKIMREIDRQFPNYAVTIELSKQDLADFLIYKTLRLRISLLTGFFTVFHEEIIYHKGVSSMSFTHMPVITTLVSGNSKIVDEHGYYFKQVKAIAEKIFPEHKFFGHYLLFFTKLKNGVPHGFLDSQYGTDFPLYNFLFDYDFVSPSLSVIVQ